MNRFHPLTTDGEEKPVKAFLTDPLKIAEYPANCRRERSERLEAESIPACGAEASPGLCGPVPGQSMARRSRRRPEAPNPAAVAAATDPPIMRRRRDDEAQIQVVMRRGGAYEASAAVRGCRHGWKGWRQHRFDVGVERGTLREAQEVSGKTRRRSLDEQH